MDKRIFLTLAAFFSALCSESNADVAAIDYVDEYGNGRSTWIVANGSPGLDEQIGYYGQASVRIRCDGTGWLSASFSSETQVYGYACGFSSAGEAAAAAEEECYAANGSNCQTYVLLNDIGDYTQQLGENDPHYALCRSYTDSDTTC